MQTPSEVGTKDSAVAPAVSRFVPWLEIACCTALALLLLWQGIIPAWRGLHTDFPNYYLVARLLREGYSLDRIYDWVWLQRIKDHWGLDQSLVGFAGLTPFSALPVVPLSIFSVMTAKRIWILLNLLFLSISVEALHRTTSLGRRRIWLISLLAIYPLRTSFLYGQMHLAVLLFIVLAWFFHRRNKDVLCGVCIALAAALKVYPLFFAFYFIWKKQWRAALATFGATIAVIAVSCLWMGTSVLHIYATQILPRSLQGEVVDPYNIHLASAAALFHRFFLFEPALNPSPFVYSPSLYSVTYPLWQIAVLLPLFALFRPSPTEPSREKLEWAILIFSQILLSPVPSSYHFVVLIFSIVLLVDVLIRRRSYGLAAIAVLLYLLISTIELGPAPEQFSPTLATSIAFGRFWAELLLFAVFLFCLLRRAPQSNPPGTPLRSALLYGGAAFFLVASILANRTHLAHIQQDMARSMQPPADTNLVTSPHLLPQGLLFTSMVPDGYRILDQPAHLIGREPKDHDAPDQLTFATGPNHSLLMELADSTGSRIVSVSDSALASQKNGVLQSTLLIQDAESPALSPDGRSITFIRERKGHGTLWIAPFNGISAASPQQAVDNSYDVRTADFLRSGELIFTAATEATPHQQHLFVATPGNPPRPLSAPDEDIASFAPSPDERLIAFTKLIHNRWQLGYFNPLNPRETMLTFGDCNASTPSWSNSHTILYASDCGRGLALPALATIQIDTQSTQ